MTATPSIAPPSVPMPPRVLTPPNTEAETVFRSKLSATSARPAEIFDAKTSEARNAIAAQNIYVRNRFLRRLMPAKRATSGLAPMR